LENNEGVSTREIKTETGKENTNPATEKRMDEPYKNRLGARKTVLGQRREESNARNKKRCAACQPLRKGVVREKGKKGKFFRIKYHETKDGGQETMGWQHQ